MAPELHKRVLAVLGFGNQSKIGLIMDKGTKALSKNRVIIGGRYADRRGGNVHASFLVMRIPTRDSIPRSACEASRRRVRRRPLGCVKCGNTSATPPHYQGVRPFDIGRKILAQIMQRLFSVFPNSLPGAGLLLLRLCDGLLLLVHSAILSGFKMSLEGLAQLVAAGAGSLILVGLATPIAAAVGGVTLPCIAAPIETHIVLATIGVSLALLGPGAWSIDARLYGRRRIDLDSL